MAVAVLMVLAVFGSILSYLRFRFCVIDDRVLVHSGVIHKEELSIEFKRIQNISIHEPFYMRPFGLAVLGIDTAGSGKKEVVLGGIARTVARSLRETILGRQQITDTVQTGMAEEETNAGLLLQRSRSDIIIYGLTVNFLLWFLIAFGAVFGAYDFSGRVIKWLAARINVEDLITAASFGGSDIIGLLVITFSILAALLLLPLISVAGALLRHHGYRLSVDGETYRKSGGLISRHEESLKRHKIQAVVWKQNFVARCFSRTNLYLRVVSADSALKQAESGQLPIAPKHDFLLPSLDAAQVLDLTTNFLPNCEPGRVKFSAVDRRRYIVKTLLLVWLPPILVVTLPLSLLISWKFALLLPVGLALAWLIVQQIWRKLGYAVGGEYGFIRSGFVGTVTTVFPLFKVQRVDLRQTPHQRHAGFAQLTIHLASHSLSLPYVCIQDAERFRDLALYYVESTDHPWY